MGPEEVDEWERMGNFLLFHVQLVECSPQFSIFFCFFTSNWYSSKVTLSENLFGTLQSARGKKNWENSCPSLNLKRALSNGMRVKLL